MPRGHPALAAAGINEGGLIAAVPIQFARLCGEELNLATCQAPADVPVPDISLYWYRRHDQDPAHRWMREQIVAALQELRL